MRISNWGKILLVILIIIFIINTFKDIVRLWRARDRLKQAEQKLEELQTDNQQLKKEQQYLKSPLFFEQQIRDKLNMSKPGEAIVILPPVLKEQQEKELEIEQQSDFLPIWRQWWDLFW